MQDNDLRSATNLRSLANRSRSDNTFAGATNLGRITANANRVTFRASGTVGKSDKVDFYKLTIDPGVNLRANGRYKVGNSSVILSRFSEFQGDRTFRAKFTLRRNSTIPTIGGRETNSTSSPVTVYLKFERPTGRTRYSFVFNFFR